MSRLLISERPLQVLPVLATEIGLNEAIFVQQLHYWLTGKSAKERDGRRWVYNTYEGWQENFPFWSVSTIRRTINSCIKQNFIITGNYNKLGIDKTKWYSINYEEINRVSSPSVQNEQTMCSKWTDACVQNEQTITIDYPETTTETIKTPPAKLTEDFEKLWKLYPNKQGKKKAFNAYCRAIKKGVTNKQIQDGIVVYKKILASEGWLKPAHGSTWFSNERWEDECVSSNETVITKRNTSWESEIKEMMN